MARIFLSPSILVVISGFMCWRPTYACTACQTIWIGLSNPTWIGNYLLVKWQAKGSTRLTWINTDGSARQEIPDASDIENIAILPGNRYVVYGNTASHNLFVLDLESGQQQPVYRAAAEPGTTTPAWYAVMSPDRQWVILVVDGEVNRQYLVRLSDLNIRDIGPGAAFLAGPTWSPDNQSIAFLESGPEHMTAGIVSLTTYQTQDFNAGQADFWFPREFVSREKVMAWTECR
jgi:dipeptidyl aminopeptidase/acylaminoacyl peptidase